MKKVVIGIIGIIFITTTTACSFSDTMSVLVSGSVNAAVMGLAAAKSTITNIAPIPAQAVQRFDGIPQSTSPEGFPQLGDPEAPAQLIGYMSFACPHCGNFEAAVFQKALADRIRAGDVFYTYVPLYGIGNIPNGFEADIAALCADKQGKFWPYQETLYSWQSQFMDESYIAERLRKGAANLDLDLNEWDQCLQQPTTQAVLDAASKKALAAGLVGTPSISVNGTLLASTDLATINAAIDQALAGS